MGAGDYNEQKVCSGGIFSIVLPLKFLFNVCLLQHEKFGEGNPANTSVFF